jgi:hypothetical protein
MPELSGTTYSEFDASNNQSAPNGMPEGMPPSGVNDSWRAAMGAIKRAYDRDHAGSWCTVGGTANAIALAYAVAPSSYVQGEKYAFKATSANSGATTINVNGLGAKNVYKKSPSGAATACTGGEIQSGDVVELEYDGTQFQLLSNAAFAGGTLTATTTMSGAAFNENYVSSAQAVVANVLDISGIAANFIDLSQSQGVNIAGFGTLPAGTERTLRFVGATPGNLVNGGTLVLPAANTIVVGQFDVIKIRSFGGGTWQLVGYLRYGGAPIYGAASAATTLGGTDTAQFLTAVGFAGNKSIAANGYYKFPGGLIVQWGQITLGGSATGTVTFPTNFQNSCDSMIVTYNTSAPPGNAATATPISASQAVVANGSSAGQTIFWIAFGH